MPHVDLRKTNVDLRKSNVDLRNFNADHRKNKRVEPSRLGAISLQPDAIKFRFLASFFDEILKKRLLWE